MKFLRDDDIGFVGRGESKNCVLCRQDRSILITSDILKTNSQTETESISLNALEEKIGVLAKDIELFSKGSTRTPESIVYGESLVEILKWIVNIMMTHKHPPNAPPIPDWFSDARNKMKELTDDKSGIVNKRVKSR